MKVSQGDYVLATKYSDGDPFDGYAVGFFDAMLPKGTTERFMVVNGDGKQYRGNGFRRCERISEELGEWIVQNRVAIEALTHAGKPVNMWRFKYGGAAERLALERWAADEGKATVRDYTKRIAFFGQLREDEIRRYAPDMPQERSKPA